MLVLECACWRSAQDTPWSRASFTPAGNTEAMFRAFHAALNRNELTLEKMAEIAEQYDQTFVGPPL